MLLLHYLSPGKTLTAGLFSKQMGWPEKPGSANLHYGKFAGKVGRQMGYPVPETKVGFFVEFDKKPLDGEGTDLWHWKMRKSLASAIKELGWGADKMLEDVAEDIGFDPITEDTEFQGDELGVAEGKRQLRQHYLRERNSKIIKQAKALAKKKYGELRCEVCDFSFAETYGDRVKEYIEGHHEKSISEMKRGDLTLVEDIAILCSNCHRTIHAKWPYISVDELKQLLKRTSRK